MTRLTKHGPDLRKLHVSSDGVGGTVHLGDQNISAALTGINLRLRVGETPQATLNVLVHDLTTEVEGTVTVPHATRRLLVQLGWTPPPEEETS